VLTASNRAAAGIYEDRSGPPLAALVREALGAEIVDTAILPDHRGAIAARLREWSDELAVDLILTTGGTGFTATDVTPEAALDVIERSAPGLAEAIRATSLQSTPYAVLSRGVAGIRGQTLIITLPGSPDGAIESLRAVLPVLPHAIALLRGEPSDSAHHGHRLPQRTV
jgi:molybdenum cofactor synthesis domain-containing protein